MEFGDKGSGSVHGYPQIGGYMYNLGTMTN